MRAATATAVERIAAWVADLAFEDVPGDVLDLCRAQRRSVLAAIAASTGDAASRRFLRAVQLWASDGPAPLPGTDMHVRVDDALFATAALSVALDFDDYLCFAHTGHSAVLTPLLLATETGSDGRSQLVAQVVANEVGGRLGGACLAGPLNGQLWSFVHAAGAALAAGRLLGLDAGRLAHALALALTDAPRPTTPGFMAPDSKLLTAADPAVAGLRAARLAAAGVTGPLDVLDDAHGFFGAFAFVPLPGMLGGLGSGWATRTLCVKPYPGCAYLDTMLDALGGLDLPPADAVEAVGVDAGLLTCGMDALSSRYAQAVPPTPVTVTFSVPWNVAICLTAGSVTPSVVESGWLAAHATELDVLRRKVVLRHDWTASRRTGEAFGRLLPVRRLAGAASPAQWALGLQRVRHEHAGLGMTPADVLRLVTSFRMSRTRNYWEPDAVDSFAMTFPARVRITTKDGATLEARAEVPRGAGRDAVVVAEEKLRTHGLLLWGTDGAARLDAAIASDAADVLRWCRGGP